MNTRATPPTDAAVISMVLLGIVAAIATALISSQALRKLDHHVRWIEDHRVETAREKISVGM